MRRHGNTPNKQFLLASVDKLHENVACINWHLERVFTNQEGHVCKWEPIFMEGGGEGGLGTCLFTQHFLH